MDKKIEEFTEMLYKAADAIRELMGFLNGYQQEKGLKVIKEIYRVLDHDDVMKQVGESREAVTMVDFDLKKLKEDVESVYSSTPSGSDYPGDLNRQQLKLVLDLIEEHKQLKKDIENAVRTIIQLQQERAKLRNLLQNHQYEIPHI